jgi:hypothetical protein
MAGSRDWSEYLHLPELANLRSQLRLGPLRVSLNIHTLVFFGLLAAGIHWLIARSSIAKPLWSRATGLLDELLRCAGCSGWWLGLGLWVAGVRPIEGRIGAFLLTGVLGAVLTPIVEATVLWGLEATAVERPAPGAVPSELFDAHDALDAIMDRLCDERSDLSPNEIERIGGTVKRALNLPS